MAAGCRPRDTPPILSVPPIALDRVTAMTAFGDDILVGKNPSLDYFVDADDVAVHAVMSGVVTGVGPVESGSGHYIVVQKFRGSSWSVWQAPVMYPTVAEGDRVVAGQVLGTVGVSMADDLVTTLTVLGSGDDGAEAYCPLSFGTESFASEHTAVTATLCLAEKVSSD